MGHGQKYLKTTVLECDHQGIGNEKISLSALNLKKLLPQKNGEERKRQSKIRIDLGSKVRNVPWEWVLEDIVRMR